MTDGKIRVVARLCGLWRESEGGWSENDCYRQVNLGFDESDSDVKIARRIKSALGITGMRKDFWAGDDWSWRSGTVGAYALVDYS